MRSRGLPSCDTKARFPVQNPVFANSVERAGNKRCRPSPIRRSTNCPTPSGFDEAPIARHHTADGGPMWKLSRLTGRASALDSNRRRCREGRHAKAGRISRCATAAGWPWVSSTIRLAANLEDAQEVLTAVSVSLDESSATHRSYISTKRMANALQPRRLKPALFRKFVYEMV